MASVDVATMSASQRQYNVPADQRAHYRKTSHQTHTQTKVPEKLQEAEGEGPNKERTWLVNPSGDSAETGNPDPRMLNLDVLSREIIVCEYLVVEEDGWCRM